VGGHGTIPEDAVEFVRAARNGQQLRNVRMVNEQARGADVGAQRHYKGDRRRYYRYDRRDRQETWRVWALAAAVRLQSRAAALPPVPALLLAIGSAGSTCTDLMLLIIDVQGKSKWMDLDNNVHPCI
jgi:hypothetical protein